MASNDEVHRVVCYNTVLVDQNSFAFKETHSVYHYSPTDHLNKPLTKKLRAGTTWKAS